MNAPSEKTIKRLFALSQNKCEFPNCGVPIVQPTGTVTGEICHIKGKRPNTPRYDETQTDDQRHAFENLILLCRVHHKIVDDEPARYDVDLLQEMKEMRERYGNVELSQEEARLALTLLNSYIGTDGSGEAQVMANSPGAVQQRKKTSKKLSVKNTINTGTIANVVNFRGKKSPRPNYTDGTIGADPLKRNYIEYLVTQYYKFREADKSFGAFSHAAKFHYSEIHTSLKSEFGASTYWNLVSRFDEMTDYLQGRIDRTILGKRNISRRTRNYDSFVEYSARQTNT
ncbi:MAG: HNH endonuclease [Verrucomicrobia bacterium]|nr:HNH endonuclease [Verrucomicrobiota bacterium]